MTNRQNFRLAAGGLIDRDRPLGFTYDGIAYRGYHGDMLAAALLANGVRLVGRSFKYHRPRGIFSAGAEEPSALVQLRTGDRTEPNVKATQIELFDGLAASSQNCWPSVNFDLGAVNNLLSRLFPAGFYYKTFMWPPSFWMKYEHFIRRAAGMGRSPVEPDPDHYEKQHAHCEVLVVGAGPAGLAAALAAGRAGARVILVEDQPILGGALLGDRATIDGRPAGEWIAAVERELSGMPETRILRRTTAFGYYDQNLIGLVERVADHLPAPPPHQVRQRLWLVRARQVVLATGAIERPLVFGGNDRPGVMLAAAARSYVNRYAVKPGERAVVFTNNDSAYATAIDLAEAGVEIAAIVDPRADPSGALPTQARAMGLPCIAGHAVVETVGGRELAAAEIMAIDAADDTLSGVARRIDCDLLAVSGGWNPAVHLFSQSRGRLRYDESLTAFVPGNSVQAERSIGAAAGTYDTASCIKQGLAAGASAAQAAGLGDGRPPTAPAVPTIEEQPARTLWAVPKLRRGGSKRFIDLQNDVTAEDIALAAREGYRSVEHVKRYTTLGMGTDQGKTSNIGGLAILAQTLGADIPAVGTTTFRPPYAPVAFGAIVGREAGAHLEPTRYSAMHPWHQRAGARFINAGLWKRAHFYPRPGESDLDAVNREALNVRANVGLVDVSTLGKIDIQGRDAAEFLDRVYTNSWKRLEIGRCRYGIMLREDGMVFDDGTTTRLGPNHFLMTTTTANAVRVMAHLEYLLQVHWPALKVYVVSVTEQWAAMALAGPNARKVLADAAPDLDVGNEALPFMSMRESVIAGIPARVFRISFSGELSYEINIPADYGVAMWEALMAAGEKYAMQPYGTEAMATLRIEKGHFVVGPEADGRTTPDDLGLGGMVSKTKDFIGKRSLSRPALRALDRKQLVGLLAANADDEIPRGAQLVTDPHAPLPAAMDGYVASWCYSPHLKRMIALALVKAGRSRMGDRLHALSPLTGKSVSVQIVPHVFIDAKG
ncbi:MAG: sarcosine oxidase subunit alpha family protein, partial [Proteobacteria bacterium]|nr:sarcosine oxidase subunit alpha family protein [Pseudomonadota bacterium]